MTGIPGHDGQDDQPRDVHVPAPARTRRKRRISGLVNSILSICVLAVLAAGAAFFYITTTFEQAGPLTAEKSVVVKRGQGSSAIAELLSREGAISNDKVFLIGLMLHDASSKLKAGEYRIEPRASMQQIMDKLIAGKSVQYKITIPEGLTTTQILARVDEQEILVGKVKKAVAEGSLLPDTYSFTRGTTRQEIINRMKSAQDKLLESVWPKRAEELPVSSPYEALILASIVEKETAVASERRQVASVFVNRLKRRMRLQSDPTIIYGLVGGQGTLGRPILKSDIAKPTPYNTYQIDGLPPTPIANPGKAAIAAVLNPAETRYLFFVADGTGGHTFASSLAEHNLNVSRWRQIERQRRQDETASEQASVTGEAPDAQTPTPAPETALPTAEMTLPASEPAIPAPAETLAVTEPAVETPKPAETSDQAAEVPETQPAPDTQQNTPVPEEPTGSVRTQTATLPQTTQSPEPAPKPKPAPISAIARAIIANTPIPKPKPRRQAIDTTRPADNNTADSAVTVTPLPDAPAAARTPTEPEPVVTQRPRQSVPNTELR